MRLLKIFLGPAVAALLGSNVSVAEDKSSQSAISYTPSLGDMMVAVQLRHSKLWYAGRTKNWRLAEYELGQLRSTLNEGAKLHSNMPAANMTATDKSAALVGEAIKLKDGAKFRYSLWPDDSRLQQLSSGGRPRLHFNSGADARVPI